MTDERIGYRDSDVTTITWGRLRELLDAEAKVVALAAAPPPPDEPAVLGAGAGIASLPPCPLCRQVGGHAVGCVLG